MARSLRVIEGDQTTEDWMLEGHEAAVLRTREQNRMRTLADTHRAPGSAGVAAKVVIDSDVLTTVQSG